jgi:hypothetical protein
MGGPDRVFGSGKRGEGVKSDDRALPPDDQKAYRTIEPGRPDTPAKERQRKAARSTGVRDPEEDENADAE